MDELTRIAAAFGTDKVEHGFCGFYHRAMADRRNHITSLLEIGIRRGESMLMWREYIPRAIVHGLDLSPPPGFHGDRLVVHTGDQSDGTILERVLAAAGSPIDIVIDDGGHTMLQQQITLGALFPHVAPGGLYVIEDLHTSFTNLIGVVQDGKIVDSYETGARAGGWTTYDMVAGLYRSEAARSDYLTAGQLACLDAEVARVEIFDRDGDRRHMSSILHKRTT